MKLRIPSGNCIDSQVKALLAPYAHSLGMGNGMNVFVTEEIQYHGGLQSRELGQAPILLCVPKS